LATWSLEDLPLSTNPILQAIESGQAPKMAKLAAAKGMLPLAPEEMLEALRILSVDDDVEIQEAVGATVLTFDSGRLKPIVEDAGTSASILGFIATWKSIPRDVYQPLIFHHNTPDQALAAIAVASELGEILELVALKQQALINHPAIIDAILANPRRTPEAERRAKEVREEFFEKQYGAQIIEGEQRAQSDDASAVVEPVAEPEKVVRIEDLFAEFIEADLIDTGDEMLLEFEEQFGKIDDIKDLIEEVEGFDVEQFLAGEEFADIIDKEMFEERVTVLARIARMSVKDRIRFALKGTREVRMILIRDPNRPVCAAVIMNPRITDQEIETISALKSVNEEVLRLIALSRAWTRNYAVIHNLVRNPKTPVALSLNFLNRIQSRDLRALGQNKNIPEVIRTMAGRMFLKRQIG
jgi:hypothetical protein